VRPVLFPSGKKLTLHIGTDSSCPIGMVIFQCQKICRVMSVIVHRLCREGLGWAEDTKMGSCTQNLESALKADAVHLLKTRSAIGERVNRLTFHQLSTSHSTVLEPPMSI
jgi:hypothetical protein